MAENESIQKWIGRNRPPRVQITYDVETYGAIRLKELPFVVGVLADLTGSSLKDAAPNPTKLKDRKFIEIDRDNFDEVLAGFLPTIKLTVPNLLAPAAPPAQVAAPPAPAKAADAKPADAKPADVKAADAPAPPAKTVVVPAPPAGGDAPKNAVVEVSFRHFDDFKPDRVIQTLQRDLKANGKALNKFNELCDLYSERQLLVDLLAKLDGNDVLAGDLKGLDKDKLKALPPAPEPVEGGAQPNPKFDYTPLDAVLTRSDNRLVRDAADEQQKAHAYNMVRQLILELNQVGRLDKAKFDKNPAGALQDCIGEVDDLLTLQSNEILHNEAFQALEATWRGLHYLAMKTETGPLLKIKVLNVSQAELIDDFDKAADKDQSALFKKIYEEEYGTFGGYPFSLLVGDYYFGRSPRDVKLLENLSKVAASAHAPMVTGASPMLFDWDSFTQLGEPRVLSKIFESSEMIPWNSYRDTEDSRYVALALPRFLLRLPYHHENSPIEGFPFDEDATGDLDQPTIPADVLERHPELYLWGNAAWALAERITHAFALYKWCAAIRGFEGGGLVEGLPIPTFKTDTGHTFMKCPTEVVITDRREKELDSLGFIALCYCKGKDYAAFFGGQMTQKPKTDYDLPDANSNARISAMLPYILAASRFAHYLKAIVREKVGSFYTSATLAEYLNRWIGNYVMGRDDAGQDLKAQYPLREARVDVTDVPGKPGAFKAVAFLRPHFQLEELTTSIRLVASLPPPAA
jgi:type VI secretion system protein ImpC